MKLVVQLYIDTSGNPSNEPVYERLDLFDFEDIELTSTIQDVKDIGNVFTDYSQEFTVPASQKNNKILKHYYNNQLAEGFDARIKQRGLILINGITFKQGFIRLSESTITKSKPSSYRLTFFGSLVNLKQALGDDEIKDLLGLQIYNHEYNIDNVYDGFIDGLGLIGDDMVKSSNRDIIYPAISASNKWYYSTDTDDLGEQPYKEGKQVNIWTDGDTSLQYGIDYLQLKPAIKVKHIISVIEETYASKGIVFSEDFFNSVDFNQLYLLMHNKKGILTTTDGGSEDEESVNYAVGTGDDNSPFNYGSGDGELRPITTYAISNPSYEQTVEYNLTLEVTNTSGTDINYKIELLNGTDVLKVVENLTGDYNFTEYIYSVEEEPFVWDNLNYKITSDGSLNSFDLNLVINLEVSYEDRDGGGFVDTQTSQYPLNGQAMLKEINIVNHLPKIKVYDFLKGLFNMFNLTSYVDDGVIVVKTLDDFYRDGNSIDISNQVDTDEITVKRMNLYSNINLDFSTPKTFGTINQNEVHQDEFGDLEYPSQVAGERPETLFDGTKYDIKLPFEKLFFERLSDENESGTGLTDFSNGWLVDKDQNETITAPVLLFNKNTLVTPASEIGFKDKSFDIIRYNRPSNSSNNELSTIHFGAEQDEYTGNTITNSLFKLYYDNYISSLFNRNSRIYGIKAYLNLSILLNYNMNDTIIINDREFFINSIRTNLTDGSSDLELITAYDVSLPVIPPDTQAPTVPTNLSVQSKTDRSITINWTESTDNVAVTGYELWIDGSFSETLSIGSMYVITGLTASTSYSIQLLAFDAAGNKSALSTALSVTTNAPADTTPPTVPTNLVLGIATSSSIGFTWDASTDNIGVTGYKVYVDGVFNQTVTSEFANVTGLSSNTSYNLSVSAIDAAGNESVQSNIIVGTTTP